MKLVGPLTFALWTSTVALAGEGVEIRVQREIDCDLHRTAGFAADATNDHHWRSEVQRIEREGEFEEGALYREWARVGRHKELVTVTKIVDKSLPERIVYETVPEYPYFLRSSRFFEEVDGGKTLFTYRVDVSSEMIEHVLGKGYPRAWVIRGYEGRMRRYVDRLDRVVCKIAPAVPEPGWTDRLSSILTKPFSWMGDLFR